MLDRNNPITAAQSNLSTSIIKQEHHPIRVVSPAVSKFSTGTGQAERAASPISGGSTLIAMMQPADLGEGK